MAFPGTVGLVAGVDGLAVGGPEFLEDDHHFRLTGDVLPDGLAQEGEEHEDPGQVSAAVAAGDRRGDANGGHPQQVAAIDEDERGGVHEVGPRRRIGKTLAVSAARPAKAAFSRVKALIVAA